MEAFAKLPDDCISAILSFTSPVDASVFSVISKRFKTLSESNTVWDKFLPSDIQRFISRLSSAIPVFPTKKELYLSLSDSPILLDEGKLSFSLDKRSGKKCFTIAAAELTFTGLIDDTSYLISVPEQVSRFKEIVVLYLSDMLSEISGKISSQMLSEETHYSSYLVYQTTSPFEGYIPPVRAVSRFVDNESRYVAEGRASIVNLDAPGSCYFTRAPRLRPDGWFEVEIGTFFNAGGNQGDVESIVFALGQIPLHLEVIVQGIEFRPEVIVGHEDYSRVFEGF